MKRFLYYLTWTIAIGLVLYFGMQLQELVVERSQATFNVFPVYLFIGLFPVVVGLLMRMPKFILQLRDEHSWTFDWVVFIAVGLPALYLVLMTFLPFSPFGEGRLTMLMFLYNGGTTVPTIAGVVFGYALLSCFKKTGQAELRGTY